MDKREKEDLKNWLGEALTHSPKNDIKDLMYELIDYCVDSEYVSISTIGIPYWSHTGDSLLSKLNPNAFPEEE